jgi:hypothetical protein
MRQFGFPQIARGDGGGDGGGGDGGSDGDWEDAYAEAANDYTDFSSQNYDIAGLNVDNYADPDALGAEAYENQDFGYGLDQSIGQSFADRGANVGWGPSSPDIPEMDPFGTFDMPGQQGPGFAAAWGQQGVGYNTNPSGPVGMPGGDPWGFDDRGANVWGSPPAMSSHGITSFPGLASRGAPDLSWATTPQAMDPRGVGVTSYAPSDWFGTPTDQSRGWAPGPPIASITVNPSQSNPGHYEQAPSIPGQAAPTTGLSYGLPAATHPGARAGEVDFGAIAGSGIDTLFSNTRGNVSPEALAYDQARNIPQQIGPNDWFSEARGNIRPELLQMEADHNTPYQMPWGWMSNTRGNLSEDDPEVQAVMARMRG